MTEKEQVKLRLDTDLRNKLKEQADKEKRSVNNMIEVMIEEYLKNHSK